VISALVLNMLVAHAFGPYSTGQAGYDISWPQCNGYSVPIGSSFGVVGVNYGRPFTSNPCFGTEYSGLANSVYINLGYAKAYRADITPACSGGASTAWDIGCSEASMSIAAVGGASPSMWWLDVETANSWSSGSLAPNRDTINGAIGTLKTRGVPVGVYSTASAWKRITGTSFAPSVDGVWVPAGQCQGTPSFIAGAHVWLTQQASTSIDGDTAC
jgi:hypothetical protein